MADQKNLYTLVGHVYDINRTTVVDGAKVKITNARTGDTQIDTTNELGEFTIELANFTTAHAVGDIITVQAWKTESGIVPRKIYTSSFLIESGDDGKDLNIYLRAVYNKRVSNKVNWNDLNQETFGHEFGTNKIMGVDAERVDITYDSSGNATTIVEYINSSRVTTTLTWTSGNCTKIEVS